VSHSKTTPANAPVHSSAESCVLVEKEPPLGWIVFNRPNKLNAFNQAVWEAIPGAIAQLEADPEVRVVILRGAGERAFSAGADISEFKTIRGDPQTAGAYAKSNEAAYRAVRECSKPTVAMIHGFCVGGACALALNIDIRIASTESRFAITPARLGLGYSFSGIEHATRELGPSATRYLFLTAAHVGADRALALGLVQEVHSPEELEAKTRELGAKIGENAPLTMRAVKASVRQSLLPPEQRDLSEIESLIRACYASRDYQEGLRAFAEKRKPRFEGR